MPWKYLFWSNYAMKICPTNEIFWKIWGCLKQLFFWWKYFKQLVYLNLISHFTTQKEDQQLNFFHLSNQVYMFVKWKKKKKGPFTSPHLRAIQSCLVGKVVGPIFFIYLFISYRVIIWTEFSSFFFLFFFLLFMVILSSQVFVGIQYRKPSWIRNMKMFRKSLSLLIAIWKIDN